MNRVRLALVTTVFSMIAPPLYSQAKVDPCPMRFSIATKDALGNIDGGLNAEDQKWLEKMLKKHYRGICYVSPTPDVEVLLLISISGRVEEVVPRVVNAPVYTLKIALVRGGKPEVLRTFQRTKPTAAGRGVPGLVSGIHASTDNPERDVILDAVDWIATAKIDLGIEPAPQQPTITIKIINAKTNHPITDERLNVALKEDQIGSVAMPADKNGIIEVKTGDATIIRILSNMYADCRPRAELYTNYSILDIHNNGITTGNLCSDAHPKAQPGELILFEIPKTFVPKYPKPPLTHLPHSDERPN